MANTRPVMVGTSTLPPSTASSKVIGTSTTMSLALPLEHRMGLHADLDQRVAGSPLADARIALALEPEHLAVSNPGRNGDVERAPIGQRKARLGAVHRIEKIDVEAIMRILPAHGEAPPAGASPRPSPLAEQIAEQIAEGADILEARGRAIARALLAAGIFAVITLLRRFLAGCVDLAAVVAPALLLVADDAVGGRDLLELLLGRLVARIEVGVQLLGELAIGLGDVLRLRGLRHAKYRIEILCHLSIEELE